MTTQAAPHLVASLKSFSHAASVTVILIGGLALIGWALDIPLLKSILPGLVTMKANTALAFILAGLSLWLLRDEAAGPRARRITHLLAGIVVLIGLLTLTEYVFSWNMGIDQLFFRESREAVGTSSPGRMAPNTALNFLLVGIALLILDVETRRNHRPAQFLILTATLISLLALIGYLYGVTALYGITSYTKMALHTAVAFTLLCLGILFARPGRGLMQVLLGDTAGGFLSRRLLPVVIGVPIVIGWVRLFGQRAGLYDTEFGISLSVLSSVVLLSVLVWMSARVLDRKEIERKQAEEELSRQTSILKSVLNSIGEGVVVADLNGKFTVWNPAAEQIVNLGPVDIPKEKWSERYGVYLPDQVTPYPADRLPLARAIRGESVDADEQFLRHAKAPRGIWLSVTGRPLIDETGILRGGVVVFNDITRRKQAAEAVKESEQRLDLALDSAQMGAWDLDLINDTAVRSLKHDQIFGYSSLQPEWGSEIFITHVVPEDRDLVKKRFEEAFATGHFSMECRIIWPDQSLHWIAAQGRAYRNQKGDPVRMMGVVTDITERKRAEDAIEKLNEDLQVQTVQLEAVNKELEAFSYSVSHDLRAPLRHINGFVELLKQHLAANLDPKGQRYMDTITDSAKQMGRLIDDLLVFSRMGKTEMQITKLHLDSLVREILESLRTETQGRKIGWKVGKLPEVYGDAAMLKQVWINLMGNAVKYTRTRKQAEIEIGSSSNGEEHIFFVKDNGVGFDPQYSGKLFGVFQRLHSSDEFEGTGIGLANVRRIVHRHGGRTWAEGRVDGGAVFYFSLPNKKEEPG